MRLRRNGIIIGAVALAAVLVGALPAVAATTSWATWQPLAGAGGAFATTVQVAAQPAIAATVTSDSRGGQVGVISGASTWLSEGTSIGAEYGSSRDQPYLNLRPKADNATSPSTTTYSFSSPTPSSGWAFALGDIDSDSVRIRAVAPDGHLLDAEELGLRDRFNYCAPGLVGKPSCTGAANDVPSWDAATLTLTGNAAAADTNGSAAWFEPTTPISSLTFFFTRRAGLPVYQTWFVSRANDISGSVQDVNTGPLGGITLTLTDGNGSVVGTTTTAGDGTYSFPGLVATAGYTVRVAPPSEKIAIDSTTTSVDLTVGDVANVDFRVRDFEPVMVSGQVIDSDGNPVSGVTVMIGDETTTTDADGLYVFDRIPVGEHVAEIVPPVGYTLTTSPERFEVVQGNEAAIPLRPFVITENPSLSGTVLWKEGGVPGVTVTAASEGGGILRTVTGADGRYTFPRLPAGSYTITMTTPDGYAAKDAVSVIRPVDAEDVVGVDFDLARLGSIDGTVRSEDGTPVGGAVVEVSGPGSPQRLTTDIDGTYGLGSLPSGEYLLTVVPAAGSAVVGDATRTVRISDDGEAVSEQDFTLVAVVAPTPSPSPTAGPGTGGGIDAGRLPATGLGPDTFLWAAGGTGVVLLGAILLVTARRRSRRK